MSIKTPSPRGMNSHCWISLTLILGTLIFYYRQKRCKAPRNLLIGYCYQLTQTQSQLVQIGENVGMLGTGQSTCMANAVMEYIGPEHPSESQIINHLEREHRQQKREEIGKVMILSYQKMTDEERRAFER